MQPPLRTVCEGFGPPSHDQNKARENEADRIGWSERRLLRQEPEVSQSATPPTVISYIPKEMSSVCLDRFVLNVCRTKLAANKKAAA